MKHSFFAAIVMVVVLFSSCKKSETANTSNPNLKGSTVLFDENGSLVTDNSGLRVTVENSNPLISLLVDSKGEFELPKPASTGMLTLVYTKEGFGTQKQYYSTGAIDSIEQGLTTLVAASLYKKSSVVVNSLSGAIDGDTFRLTCNVSVSNANTLNAIRFFVQKNSDAITPDNCLTTKNTTSTFAVKNGDNSINLCMKCMEQCGYESGDKLYLKAYGDLGLANFYTDLSANKLVFPCVNTNSNSSVVSFIVP